MRASCTRQVTNNGPAIGSPVSSMKNEINWSKPKSSTVTVIG